MTDRRVDVLIAGAGAAGLRAALAAREAGAERVLIVSKTESGVDNCSGIAWGGLSGAVGGADADHYASVLAEYSEGIAQPELARKLAEASGPALQELVSLGVESQVHRAHLTVSARPRHPGEGLTLPLLRRCREAGVEFAEPAMLVHLLRDAQGCRGAMVLDLVSGDYCRVLAGATILATGGFAGLYARNDNPAGTAGDGLALGLLAGARAIDLEFATVFELGLAEEGCPQDGCYFGPAVSAGVVTDDSGLPLDRAQRDEHWRDASLGVERRDGRYDLWLDLTQVTPEQWLEEKLALVRREILLDLPVSERPVRVSPLAHFTPGGLMIDERARTAVPGLFAAGEVAGGVFGAGRPGGGALTDAIVFGAVAGREAAEYAARTPRADTPAPTESLPSLSSAPAARPPSQVLSEIGWALWNYVSLWRNGPGLEACLAWLRALEPPASAGPVAELRALHEARLGRFVAQAVTRAALLREETRGRHHRRTDYPEPDAAWQRNIIWRVNEDGELAHEVV